MAGFLFIIGSKGVIDPGAVLANKASLIHGALAWRAKIDHVVHGADPVSEREARELVGLLSGLQPDNPVHMLAPDSLLTSPDRDMASWSPELEIAERAFLASVELEGDLKGRSLVDDMDWSDDAMVEAHELARFRFRKTDDLAKQATLDRARRAWYALANRAEVYRDRNIVVVAAAVGAALRWGGGIRKVEEFGSEEAMKWAIRGDIFQMRITGPSANYGEGAKPELIKRLEVPTSPSDE